MSILAWLAVGSLVGLVANLATGGRSGCLTTFAVCIVGGLIGGALFSVVGQQGGDDFSGGSMLAAFVGALLFLLVLRPWSRGGPRR